VTKGKSSKQRLRSHRWEVASRVVGKVVDHPRTSLAVGVLGLIAAFLPFALPQGEPSTNERKAPASSGVAVPAEDSSGTADPFLSGDASCQEFRKTVVGGVGERRLFVDSPGQIAGELKVRVVPDGRFHGLIHVPVGSEVEVSALLHNPAYSAAEGISVSASIAADRGTCWRIIAHARTRSLPGVRALLGPSLILLKGGASATLEYVEGSTKLFDEQGRTLAEGLSDDVTTDHILLPYSVPGGTAYYLNFRMRVKARRHNSALRFGGPPGRRGSIERACEGCAMRRSMLVL
jgi:hypothetical protein